VKVLIIGFACKPAPGWRAQQCVELGLGALALPPGLGFGAPTRPQRDRGVSYCSPKPTLSTEWVGFPKMLDDPRLRRSNLVLAIHYQMWLRVAYKKAIKLHRQVGF